MGWFGPDQCDEHCCEPPTPCLKPVLTCRKTDDPQTFHYTITGADEAWILESCRTSGGGVTNTSYPITLSGGAASGSFSTSPECTYCVTATNACGTEVCCDQCDTPVCRLTAEPFSTELVRVNWFYGNNADPLLYGSSTLVTSVTVNGVDVFVNGFTGTGSLDIPKADLPSTLVMIVTNDCGKTTTCTFKVPCCWNKSTLSVSISSVSDISRSCTWSPSPASLVSASFGTEIRISEFISELSWTGLTALNGTYLFDVPGFACRVTDIEHLAGTVTAEFKTRITLQSRFTTLPGVPTRTEVVTSKLRIENIQLYVRYNSIWLQLPSTATIEVTGLNPANPPGVDQPIAPNYASVVNMNTTYRWMQGTFGVQCPTRSGDGTFKVVGPGQLPIGYIDNLNAGWMKSILSPATLPGPPYQPVLFVIPPSPLFGPLSLVNKYNQATGIGGSGFCDAIENPEPLNVFTEFLV